MHLNAKAAFPFLLQLLQQPLLLLMLSVLCMQQLPVAHSGDPNTALHLEVTTALPKVNKFVIYDPKTWRRLEPLNYLPNFEESKRKAMHYLPNFEESKRKAMHYLPNLEESKRKAMHYLPNLEESKRKAMHYLSNFEESKRKAMHYLPNFEESKRKAMHYLPNFEESKRKAIQLTTELIELPRLWSPCTCKKFACTCCLGLWFGEPSKHRICVVAQFDPTEMGIELRVNYNRYNVATFTVSARNPPAYCRPILVPLPIFICLRLYDIQIIKGNVQICWALMLNVFVNQLFEYKFDCIRFGTGGIQHCKPVLAPTSTPAPLQIEEQTETQNASKIQQGIQWLLARGKNQQVQSNGPPPEMICKQVAHLTRGSKYSINLGRMEFTL